MDDLFYFPKFDVLTKITYAADVNSLRYASHRKVTSEEKKVIERYILQEIAPKTDYYKKSPSLLLYMGVDASLKKELKIYQVKDTIKNILVRKEEIDIQVRAVISSALSEYYFERLGDRLLELREAVEEKKSGETIEKLLKDVAALLEAYNQNSGRKVAIESVLPKEVISQFHQLLQS